MTNLLNCPFCGSEACVSSYPSCDCCGKAWNGAVSCKKCPAEVSHFDTDVEAIAAWNTRAAAHPAQSEAITNAVIAGIGAGDTAAEQAIEIIADLNRIGALARPAPTREPAAWRYQMKEGWDGIWRVVTVEPTFEFPNNWRVEPLFAHTGDQQETGLGSTNSLPSGESDPAVTSDYAGAGTNSGYENTK